ncbi:MAG: DNA polymerase subunit beta [Draconibacterium sp.]|nr:DNA polymerase subunit beta [Draconibacterium sp.]
MVIKDLIKNRESDFEGLCQNHSVKFLFAFGSSVTDNFDFDKSDIDLVVEIEEPDPISRGEKIMSLWDKLEEFFMRKVDLLTNPNIRNPYLRQSVNESKILIYDGSKQKIPG